MLYDRIVHQGTLSEPNGAPDPQFALPSTINWMHALALIVRDRGFEFTSAGRFYSSIQTRAFSTHEENTTFEQLLFALHQLSALEALRLVPRRTDVARVGIVAWYYGVYAAATAMVAAQDGSFQDGHAGTANSWDRHFAARNLVIPPFALRISTLIERERRDRRGPQTVAALDRSPTPSYYPSRGDMDLTKRPARKRLEATSGTISAISVRKKSVCSPKKSRAAKKPWNKSRRVTTEGSKRA